MKNTNLRWMIQKWKGKKQNLGSLLLFAWAAIGHVMKDVKLGPLNRKKDATL
jgi:hypothetical protein